LQVKISFERVFPLRNLNILVVDDSMLTINKIRQMLVSMGHNVIAYARNGKEAFKASLMNEIDLITMDITMPDMDGIEACRKILEKKPNLLIIMVTSHGQENMVLRAIDAGAKGYLLKPIEPESLERVIKEVFTKYGDDN
jgi:two-component system, chemotaxis family, chemotaxis protein CheY